MPKPAEEFVITPGEMGWPSIDEGGRSGEEPEIGNIGLEETTERGQTALSATERKVFGKIREWGIAYTYKHDGFVQRSKTLTYQRVYDQLYLHCAQIGGGRIRAALDSWMYEQKQLALNDLVAELRQGEDELTKAEGQLELERWIDCICCEGQEYSTHVMKHWIWQWKRKLAGLPTQEEMVPVLYGMTRSGKSTAIRNLLKPIQQIATESSINMISDERQWSVLAHYYIVYIDELAGADKACLDMLKTVITSPMLLQRQLYTHRSEHLAQHATFIATSNKPIRTMIPDETSAARWWELRVHKRCKWDRLNLLDPLKMFASVHTTDECPLTPDIRDKIQVLQHEKLRNLPYIEQWIMDKGLEPGSGQDKVFLSHKIAQAYFKQWCTDKDVPLKNMMDVVKFSREMGSRGYEKARSPDVKRERGRWYSKEPIEDV